MSNRMKLRDRYPSVYGKDHGYSLQSNIYKKFKNVLDYLISMDNPAIKRQELDSWYVPCDGLEDRIRQIFTDVTSVSRLLIGYTGMGKSTLIRHIFYNKDTAAESEDPSVFNEKHLVIPFFFTKDHIYSKELCVPFINKTLAYASKKLKEAKGLNYGDREFLNYIEKTDFFQYLDTAQRETARAKPKEGLLELERANRNEYEIFKLKFLVERAGIENIIIVADDIESLHTECTREIVHGVVRIFNMLSKYKKKYPNRERPYETQLLVACRFSTVMMLTNNDPGFRAQAFPRTHDIVMEQVVDLCALFDVRFDSAIKRLKKEAYIMIKPLPSGVDFPTDPNGDEKMYYLKEAGLLFFKGVMSLQEKERLKHMSDNTKYKLAIDKLYMKSGRIIGNLETWKEACEVLKNLSNILCRKYSNAIAHLCNYNVRESMREFQTILTNRRWCQKNTYQDAQFRIRNDSYNSTLASSLRALGLREGDVYPGPETPIANLLWNQPNENSDLLLSHVIRWFIMRGNGNQAQLRRWCDVQNAFELFFDIESKLLKELLINTRKYMLSKEGRLLHSEIDNPQHDERSYQLSKRAEMLWKILDTTSLYQEFYRDDVFHKEGELMVKKAINMSGGELFIENLCLCSIVLEKEKKILKFVKEKNLIPMYKDVFGTVQLSEKLLKGIENSIESYYYNVEGRIPSSIVEEVNNFKRKLSSEFSILR